MATITYNTITVTGIEFDRILSLCIKHEINTHATATVKGELDYDKVDEAVARLSEASRIEICTTASGQPHCLICGVVSSSGITYEDSYAVLEINLLSTTYLLDVAKQNRSYQKTGDSFLDVLNKLTDGTASIDMKVTDSKIGNILMQYNETAWEFTQKIAGKLGAVVIPDIVSIDPRLTVGLPESTRSVKAESLLGTLVGNLFPESGKKGNTSYGTSYDYAFLGDDFDGKGTIVGVVAELVDGILKCIYRYGKDGISAFIEEKPNTQIAGRMFLGEVQEVKEDKVRVFLKDIDGSFDSESDYWFPYSTAYSSSDGSGFYCMPAEKDLVRVFFPSENEADAFAASSVNVSPLENPLHKSWRNGDKELLLTPEGIRLSCNNTRMYITLDDKNGISIYSSESIQVRSPKNVTIKSHTKVEIEGKEQVFLHSGESYIDIQPEGISFGGKEMLVN